MCIYAATPLSICPPLVNERASVPGRQQENSCLPLRDYKVCTHTHIKRQTHIRTVLGELQQVVEKRGVPVKGAQPGEEDGARIRVIEAGGQGARRVWQLTEHTKNRQERRKKISLNIVSLPTD